MYMPLELYELAWSKPELVPKYSEELFLLLGSEIREFSDFKRIGVKVSRMSSARGIKYPDKPYKDVVHYYKNIKPRSYMEHPILAAMRGSVTREYENGEVKQVAFPFAKFFNRGEIEATQRLPQKGFIATEKLDGTLIVVWVDPDTSEIRFNTRGLLDRHTVFRGKTSYYVQATPDRTSNPFVIRFINAVKRLGLWYELESLVNENRTVMFELVYKIPASYQFDVLETPEDSLDWKPYLLAYRDHQTLEIVYPENTAFPVPRRYDVDSFREVFSLVMKTDNNEGVVLYYPGHLYRSELPWWNYLVKLKNRIYVLKSYIHSGEATWKHLALLVINGKEDDLIPIVDKEKAEFLKQYREKYNKLLETWTDFVDCILSLKEKYGDKVYRVLAYNLKMKHIVRYLKIAEAIEKRTGDRETAIKHTLESIVKEFLIYKDSKDAMLKAPERLAKRLDNIKEQVREQYR